MDTQEATVVEVVPGRHWIGPVPGTPPDHVRAVVVVGPVFPHELATGAVRVPVLWLPLAEEQVSAARQTADLESVAGLPRPILWCSACPWHATFALTMWLTHFRYNDPVRVLDRLTVLWPAGRLPASSARTLLRGTPSTATLPP